jgi:hypothetical protein
VRLIVSFEDILLRNKSKNGDRFIENEVNFIVGFLLSSLVTWGDNRVAATDAFQALLEILIDEEGDVFR